MKAVVLFFITAVPFIIGDLTWLGVVARNFYRNELVGLIRTEIFWPGAILFYVIYISGILFFAVYPSLKESGLRAFLLGAALGFFAYGTYDLTNLATLKGWSISVTWVDIIWGTCLTGFCAWLSHLAATKLLS